MARWFGLLKRPDMESFYNPGEEMDCKAGKRAINTLNTIIDKLETKLSLPVNSGWFWVEYRNETESKYIRPIKWPVGLIVISNGDINSCSAIPEKTQDVIQHQKIREYEFGMIQAANSVGGIKEDNLGNYVLQIEKKEKRDGGFFSYRETSAELERQLTEKGYEKIGSMIDFVRLEGYDDVSGARIYLDLGMRPRIKAKPSFFSMFGQNGQLKNAKIIPPKDALQIYPKAA